MNYGTSMEVNISKLIRGLNRRPGATDGAIAECEALLAMKLPPEYIEFVKLTNGGEGFIGDTAYVMLWRVEELAAMNQMYEVGLNAPGLVLIGSDGGGEAYGFDARPLQRQIVQVPFVGMSWESAQPVGTTFRVFLERLHRVK